MIHSTDFLEKATPLQKNDLTKIIEHPDSMRLMTYLVKNKVTSDKNAKSLLNFKPELVNLFYNASMLNIRINENKKYYFMSNYGLRIAEYIKSIW